VAIAPHLTPSYDVLKDLTPIAKLIDQPIIAVVNSASGITDLRTLVQEAKADALPGYASPGHGSTAHRGRLFNQVAGMQLQEIPYKGLPAITDLVAVRC
jgi:tripartite-type tricarboxylate transporter receptor subunit TctC